MWDGVWNAQDEAWDTRIKACNMWQESQKCRMRCGICLGHKGKGLAYVGKIWKMWDGFLERCGFWNTKRGWNTRRNFWRTSKGHLRDLRSST